MRNIPTYIEDINTSGYPAFSVFITSGYPDKISSLNLAKAAFDNGVDFIELGIPFSDPIADGSTIQATSDFALSKNITPTDALHICETIMQYAQKPVFLMTYCNILIAYGVERFILDAKNSGAAGFIIADLPFAELPGIVRDKENRTHFIPFLAPTSTETKIQELEKQRFPFIYYTGVTGTTGGINQYSESLLTSLKYVKKQITKNKLVLGFGLSTPEDIIKIRNYCDGFIIGSALLKKIEPETNAPLDKAIKFIRSIDEARKQQ